MKQANISTVCFIQINFCFTPSAIEKFLKPEFIIHITAMGYQKLAP